MASILIDIGHPAHVHLFRNAAKIWQEMGHRVHFSALDREMILELLERYGFSYDVTYRRTATRRGLLYEIPPRTWRTLRIARKVQADLLLSMANPTVGFPALLLRKPYLAFHDTEPAYNQLAAALPFATMVATPEVYYRDAGKKQVRYKGYHELAYLHPKHFTPDASVLAEIGLAPGERYFIVRFVAWQATHDVHEHGLTLEDKRAILTLLEQHGRVILSTEDEVPAAFAHHITEFPQDRMHDLLAFAQIYIGEGNTMAAEAAELGTPSIRANTMDLGYCRDLQRRGLMFQLVEGQAILSKINELLSMPGRADTFRQRRATMLAETTPTTDAIVEFGLRLLDGWKPGRE